MLFPEIIQLGTAQAAGSITIINHLLKLAIFVSFTVRILWILLDQELLRHNILRTKQQNTFTRLPVTSSTTCFLNISFHIFGHIVVNYVPDIGFINPHPKGIRSHHDPDIVIEEPFLAICPLLIIHTCVIAACRYS
ncbi:hypothetical protein D3C76_1092150 [compost metagenome]